MPSRAPARSIKEEVNALKRARTLAAAAELFYERGYENTTLDMVAERLGVTKPFIYAHFDSKSDLLAEICSRGAASSLEVIDGVLAHQAPAPEKLALFAEQFVTAVLENQIYNAIFTREEKNLLPADFQRIDKLRREFRRKLIALLDEGVAKGEFALGDTHIAALAISGMASFAYGWYRPTGRLTREEVARRMAELILAMAQVEPVQSPK